MGRGKRKRRQNQQRSSYKVSQQMGGGLNPQSFAGFSGYSGANQSTKRARVWWPEMDTRRELDSFSRAELVRRVRWLYANVGLAKRLVKGLAEMVGYLRPQAITDDAEWNTLAENSFAKFAGSKNLFDVAGKFNFYTAQLMLTRSWIKDGDILTALTSTNAVNGIAQVAFYEAHQLVTPRDLTKEQTWVDGVRISSNGRHKSYGIRHPKRGEKPYVINARNAIYFGEHDSCGHVRAVPPMSHAVNHTMDITEIWADVKTAIKTSSLSGMVRTQENPDTAYKGKAGLHGRVVNRPIGTPTAQDPDKKENITMEDVYGGAQINQLAPGEDLKVIADPRPSQNQRDQISDLIRDVSWGVGVAPEVTWHMAGLTGPGVRFVLEQTNRWVEARQQELELWCQRFWVYFIAKEVKAGRLRECEDENWRKTSWMPQRSMTIDRGRDGKQRLDEIASGNALLGTWTQEAHGMDAEDVIRGIVRETKFKMEECEREGVDFNIAFPPRQGAAVADSDDDDDSKNKKKVNNE